MASKFYGVRAEEQVTSINDPIKASSGITIAFGTAPVYQVGGEANQIELVNSYDEAVAAMGYSDNWDKYTLCEVMYSHFKLYGVTPLYLVNILDPEAHKEAVDAASMAIANGQIQLPGDAIASTVAVTDDSTEFVAGTDYDIFYEDDKCVIEVLSGGAIDTAGLASVTVAYSQVSFQREDLMSDMVGGLDVTTGQSSGLELMDKAYFKGGVLPDLLIAPGFSQNSEVAAVMATKTIFSTVFRATCLCDLDTAQATNYLAAVELKENSDSFQNPKQFVLWPMLALEDKVFHYSTQYAGLQCSVDAANDNVPSRVGSNQALKADSAVLADGTEVILDLDQANYLRGNGICTAYNFVNGFTAWGVYSACYPNSTDPKDMFLNISRMFNYVANTVIMTYWSRIDEKLTPRYAESIIDELSIWLNSLVGSGDLLGARCEFKSVENPVEDLMNGIVRVHIYMTPPTVAQEIDFLLEYDVDYVSYVLGDTGDEM